MALINVTSLAGLLLVLYLSSFVLLAILRITTGVSVQRLGLSSLRHVSLTPREGLRIKIRGLGLAIHRPTFAQPTWISLRLQELCVTVDPVLLQTVRKKKHGTRRSSTSSLDEAGEEQKHGKGRGSRSQLWKKLTKAKEQLKQIHHRIDWLRMLDINATNSSLEVVGVGSVSIGSFTLAVHTRRKLLDRGRLFRHKKDPSGGEQPAEWIFTTRSVLLGVSGREPVEILDAMSFNVHGLLYPDKEGLRDTSLALKVGRLYLPVDDILSFKNHSSALAKMGREAARKPTEPDISFDEVVQELDQPGSREAAIVQTVADSKEFFGSILRNVQEIQLGMSFIRLSKELDSLRRANLPVIMNVVTHEIGIDLHRMDQNSPAHRMYFSRHDVAHQALIAAISITVSLDEADVRNKILYVPMATTTIRTTLPSKTMNFTRQQDAAERNSNILFANLVVTSPSLDLVPQHLNRIISAMQSNSKTSTRSEHNRHRLISRLLPRADIKLSVHEPVVRFVLPTADPSLKAPEDYDMIISSISSVSLDVESSHSATSDLLYSLASNFRVVSHKLYYQAASGIRHNLITTDSLELKAQVTASKEVLVVISGTLRSFSVLMIRSEVSRGVYNIARHFKRAVNREKLESTQPPSRAFLRKLPSWLLEFHFEGTHCSLELAGTDATVSKQTRGVSCELDSWNVNYVAHREETPRRPSSRRKISASVHMDEPPTNVTHLSPPSSPARHHVHHLPTDGRRLTLHLRGLQGFIVEALDELESKPFMSIPRVEVAFSTSRDQQGSVFHIHSAIRAIYLEFSLYRAYSIGIAASVLQDAFTGPPSTASGSTTDSTTKTETGEHSRPALKTFRSGLELVTIDFKASYVQVKAQMPADPPILLQIYELTTGRHRWSAPFLRCLLVRLHAESPHVKAAWARVVSMSNLRVDMRQVKKRTPQGLVEEKSMDLNTDFIRLAVPHGLMMYKVFDNFVNTFKAMQQMGHKFKTRTNEYILQKEPEGPKLVPRVSYRTKALMFEIEDDGFEWKLGNIYRVGRNEQKQRMAREDAFNLKVKRLHEEKGHQGSSRRRAQSTRPASRSPSPFTTTRRSSSQDSASRRYPSSRGRDPRHSKLRYDRDGACALSSDAKIQFQEAKEKLEEHNSRSWKQRIDWINRLQNKTVKSLRRMFTGADEPPPDVDAHETILSIPYRPGLLSIVVSDLHLVIDKPSFPLSSVPSFLHEVGKGMPFDMKYALLIPMSISLDMGEARFMLRDYPLNLLHVPAIRPGQSPRMPSWSLKTDFVIAEEYRDGRSSRHVKVDIVPRGGTAHDGTEIPGFALDVRRTVSPVKTFSKPVIEINTSAPTSISWGTSYQPTIQDVMMIIEGFTKPEVDPSDRVGFWDKIRLSFHSRPIIKWKGDGDVHFRLKGSRDPYVVTGYGAGFVMCWRNNVSWAIHEDDDPKKFMTVKSGEYVLAVPDYSHQAQGSPEDMALSDMDSMSSSSTQKNAAVFKKVITKISGNVQWTAGLVFEQDKPDGERSLDFEPHYNVVLKNPKFMSAKELAGHDAFRGFRSHHIHMSLAVAAPFDRDWTSPQLSSSESYNSIHLSPRFFSHFFDWWSLFSGVMSLPIRQGPLWRGPEKTSKKFGRHLATIKYSLLLSPLFIAHVYKHKDSEDYLEDVVSATGLKLRLNSFIFDVHQRREYFDTMSKTKSEQTRTSAMKINKAEVDFVHADLRAVAANIAGTTAQDLKRANDEALAAYQGAVHPVDMSRFSIPDHDFSWIDMDDFVELDWILPAESNPETKILPLSFTPRFTYFRQTDHGDAIHGDTSRTSPFGEEDTHFCVMSHHNDPRVVQTDLIKTRLDAIEAQLQEHERLMGEYELKFVRDGDQAQSLQDGHEMYLAQQRELESKKAFLQQGLNRLSQRERPGGTESLDGQGHRDHSVSSSSLADSDQTGEDVPDSATSQDPRGQMDTTGLQPGAHDDFASDFNNRFIIHNAQIKWNNSLRNIVLRYSHQVGQRRGFVYYMSRRAVKFILDIVDEQARRKEKSNRNLKSDIPVPATPSVSSPTEEKDEDTVVEDRIQQLLNDAKRFVKADDPEKRRRQSTNLSVDPNETISDNFQAMNGYHVRLIAPQIQLQSEKNIKSVVLLTAKGMQLKVVSIMDKERLSDDVSGLVQRQFTLDMDSVQIFVTNQKTLSKFIHLYSGNRYGNAPGSSWPPWASIEAMFDFHLDPFGFQRVVQKTSASLRYEKYNALRLKYNEEVAKNTNSKKTARSESRIDHLWVDFPRLRARCDSAQYYTMYIIVLDLLLYSEPLEKTRSEKLEKIMLASDFSDLRGAPEIAESLQERIRQLEDLKLHFMLNAKYLDKHGWQDRIDLEKDLAMCEDELFFIMKAINTSQQRSDDRSSQSSGFLRWYLSASEIVWHLMRDKNDPLLEFQLGNAAYERVDNSDGSNNNAVVIENIRGWNLLRNALYPEIIGPYVDPQQKQVTEEPKMLEVQWFMLEAIAGIPVLEEFEVTMHPLRVQLERSLGKALFEYIFPGIGSNAFDNGSFSPLMVKNMKPLGDEVEDEEGEKARDVVAPRESPPFPGRHDMRGTSPGAFARRLQPTYNLNYRDRTGSSTSAHTKSKGLGLPLANHRHGLFHFTAYTSTTDKDSTSTTTHHLNRQSSTQSLRSTRRARDSTVSLNGDAKSTVSRTASRDRRGLVLKRADSHNHQERPKKSDDVSQMMQRASNYMTLAHVKLNSFVICLSYKGQRDRNFEDLHDFVFRMPVLEYQNKTWSNLDLALKLKKDVIKALISHTGAIIGNKFSHHRPGKKQQERLREIALGNTIVPNGEVLSNTTVSPSDQSSFTSTARNSEDVPSRKSFQSADRTPVRNGSKRSEHGPLLRSGNWHSINSSKQRQETDILACTNGNGNASVGNSVVGDGTEAREVLISHAQPRPGTSPAELNHGQSQDQDDSSSRAGSLLHSSSSRMDPLSPIIGILPRPTTSHGSFIPGKSLLKDALGRHFSSSEGAGGNGGGGGGGGSGGGSGGGILPTISRGRVRFSSGYNSDKHSGGIDTKKRGRATSDPSGAQKERDSATTFTTKSGGDESDGEAMKKKSVLLLGKKVLGQLRDL